MYCVVRSACWVLVVVCCVLCDVCRVLFARCCVLCAGWHLLFVVDGSLCSVWWLLVVFGSCLKPVCVWEPAWAFSWTYLRLGRKVLGLEI